MNRNIIRALLVILAVAAFPSSALANGFFIYEGSAAGMGQGGATIADGSDSTAAFYNPAGLAMVGCKPGTSNIGCTKANLGVDIQLTYTLYLPSGSFKTPDGKTTDQTSSPVSVPAFFASYKALDWLSAGVGLYTMYGLAISWPKDWVGRDLIVSSSLQSTQLQPTLAFGPFKGFSFGGGVDFLFGAVDIHRGMNFGDGTSNWSTQIAGTAFAVGYNLGLFYNPIKQLNIGAVYHSKITVDLDPGKVYFKVPDTFKKNFLVTNQEVRTSLTLPQVIGIGIRGKPIDDLELELDALYVGWWDYRSLTFKFNTPPGAASLDQTAVKDWHDAWQIRFGAQYKLSTTPAKGLAFRLGVIWDQSPVPDSTLDPMLPDSERVDVSVGIGYSFWKMRVDIAYMLVYFFPKTVDATVNPFPGTYNTMANVLSLGVGANF